MNRPRLKVGIKQKPKNLNITFSRLLSYIKKYYLFNFYCPTKAESDKVKELLQIYEAKYFVSESKKL